MITARKIASFTAMVAVTGLLLSACASGDGSGDPLDGVAPDDEKPVFSDGVLQPLSDGFPNKAIQVLNWQDAGGRDGIYGRALVAGVKDMSPVDVIVVEDPGGAHGQIYKVQQKAHDEDGRDGYYPFITTLPGFMADFYQQPVEQELGITSEDINPIINTEVIPYVLIQRKEAPWGPTFDGLVQYAKANPGEVRYISNQVGTGHDLAMEWILEELDISVHKIPAGSAQQAATSVGAGEGDFTFAQADTALSAFQSGVVDATLVSGDSVPEPWTDDPNVVSAEDYGLPPASWGAVMSLIAPSTTPKSHVNWLYELFRRAAENPEYTGRTETIPGVQLESRDPELVYEIAQDLYGFMGPTLERLGLVYED